MREVCAKLKVKTSELYYCHCSCILKANLEQSNFASLSILSMSYFVYQPVEVTRKFSADNCEDNTYNSLIKAYM